MAGKKDKKTPSESPRRSSGGWIKWEKDIESDPRFLRMVRKLRCLSVTQALPERISITLIIGGLVKLWSYADTHIRKDDILDLGKADLDDLIGIPGFSDALPDSWLLPIDDSHVQLPDFQRHNGVIAKRQALTNKRVANFKQRNGNAEETHEVTHEKLNGNDHTLIDQTRPSEEEELRKAPETAPIATAGDAQMAFAAVPDAEAPFDPDAYLIWKTGLEFIGGEKQRTLMGRLQKQYGAPTLSRKLSEIMSASERPVEPIAYLMKVLKKTERGAVC